MSTNKAKISVEYSDDNSTVTLSGSYDNVITALCAGIKGLVINMCNHPKYTEIRENSNMTNEEFIEEITYSVIVNIMDRLDQHQVLSISDNGNNNKDVATISNEVVTDNVAGVSDNIYDAFEEFAVSLDTEEILKNDED